MTTALHTDNSQLSAKHQANIMATLAHRIEAAQAAHNTQLIELLEREQQEVRQAASLNQGVLARFNALKQRIVNLFSRNLELQVHQYNQGTDCWWYAFDPRTGDCVYASSEAELRLWIEQNYRSR